MMNWVPLFDTLTSVTLTLQLIKLLAKLMINIYIMKTHGKDLIYATLF